MDVLATASLASNSNARKPESKKESNLLKTSTP